MRSLLFPFILGLGLGCVSEAPADEGTEPACPMSAVGEAVALAAQQAPTPSAIPADALLSFANQSGPALLDGGAIFGELADLIAGAERSVDIAMFVWELESDASRALLGALETLSAGRGASEPPVEVRILVNAIAASDDGIDAGDAIAAAVAERAIDPARVRVEVATRVHAAFGAMHQKLAIIDGTVAHLGGANVEAVHDWTGAEPPWRDSAYVVRGAIAGSLAVEFAALWGGEVRGPAAETDDDGTCTPMIALSRWPSGLVNNRADTPMARGYLAAFAAAERSIEIQTPNLNDDAVRAALLDAVARGVAVRILVSRDFNEATENLVGQGGGNRENVDRLYAEATIGYGAEHACSALDVRWYARPGDGVIDGNVAGASHLKYARVDEQVVIVGSANMDTQSWNYSGETNVAIDDRETAARYDAAIFAPSFSVAVPTGHCER